MKIDFNNRWQLIDYVKSQFPNGVGAEIGVYRGDLSKYVLENWGGRLWMIDPWRALDVKEYDDSSGVLRNPTSYLDAMDSIKGYEDKGLMIRALSNQAVDLFQDSSLDFIYIDANHAYDYIKEDLDIWYPKLKPGGYFMGHDYLNPTDPSWWYNDLNFVQGSNNKNKQIFVGDFNAGTFGVNPAVDEFAAKHQVHMSYTTEDWFGTWWTVKP